MLDLDLILIHDCVFCMKIKVYTVEHVFLDHAFLDFTDPMTEPSGPEYFPYILSKQNTQM